MSKRLKFHLGGEAEMEERAFTNPFPDYEAAASAVFAAGAAEDTGCARPQPTADELGLPFHNDGKVSRQLASPGPWAAPGRGGIPPMVESIRPSPPPCDVTGPRPRESPNLGGRRDRRRLSRGRFLCYEAALLPGGRTVGFVLLATFPLIGTTFDIKTHASKLKSLASLSQLAHTENQESFFTTFCPLSFYLLFWNNQSFYLRTQLDFFFSLTKDMFFIFFLIQRNTLCFFLAHF